MHAPLKDPITAAPVMTLARLGETHGYRFDGDTVHLHATLNVAAASAHTRQWALQLWACPSAPDRTDSVVGHLIAQAVLPPLSEVADSTDPIEIGVSAQPPAGDRDHSMVMVLVANRAGQFTEVHDVASYPSRERFILPRFRGVTAVQSGGFLRLAVEEIENPRDSSNTSGTLAIEIWALRREYDGGFFDGEPIAGTTLGTLPGQTTWTSLNHDFEFSTPSPEFPQLVVMLREWTGASFTTRDFVNIPLPVQSPRTAAPVAPAPTIKAREVAPVPTETGVSINHGTATELSSVKGLPKVAIVPLVDGRPYATLEDLLRVKGIGAKLLAKIRHQLRL